MWFDYLFYLFISVWFMMSVIVMLVVLAFVHQKFYNIFDWTVKMWKLVFRHV